MFSSEELISYVFANESDLYYGNDLLKLNLNQYLWKKLHKQYETVYFLRAKDGLFQVRTFGDRKSDPEWKKTSLKLLGKSDAQKQGIWLQRQLEMDQRCAIVCPLEDFCMVMEEPVWEKKLREIAADGSRRGKIVLTVSETAERSSKYLLGSPVFDWLGEKAVTDARVGSLRPLYPQLKNRKGDDLVFLNMFTRERMRSLLLHIMMENPDRFVHGAELEAMAVTLVNYLNDTRLQKDDLFLQVQGPLNYLRYRDVYAQLRDSCVWDNLLRLKESCAALGSWEPKPEILRDKGSFAGKCMMLQLPRWLRESGSEGDWAENMLEKIRREVAVPKNRPENPMIIALIEGHLDRLEAFCEPDIQTFNLVLKAMEFCTQWLHMESDSGSMEEFLKIVRYLDACISVSDRRFRLARDISLHSSECDSKSAMTVKLAQMRKELELQEQKCYQYQQLADVAILDFGMPRDVVNHDDLLQEIEDVIGKEKEQAEENKEVHFDDDFVFTTEMYSYRPPTLKN